MARMFWDTYRCRQCKRTLELPHVWVNHRQALHCGACPGTLVRVLPRRERRAHAR